MRSREQGVGTVGTEPECLGALGRGPRCEERDHPFEVVGAVFVADDLRDRAGAAAGSERKLRARRVELREPALDDRARRLDLGGGGRVAREQRGGEAKRSEVDRPDPGGPEQLRADDQLRRAAADVADGDDALAGVRARDGTFEGEAAFLLCGDDADVPGGRTSEHVEQARGLVALASGRRDDGLELAHAELARDPGIVARHLRDLVELATPDPAVPQQLLAEPEMRAFLANRAHVAAADRGNQKANRVRAHVDDPNPHPGHSGEHAGQTTQPHCDRVRAPPARRLRAFARRCRLT